MTSQSANERLNRASNDILEATSFLFGIERGLCRGPLRPVSGEPRFGRTLLAAYFAELGQTRLTPAQIGRGPAWARDLQARACQGELVGALTGQAPPRTAAGEQDMRLAAQESIRAIQLVRAYRVIGHLEADLDPLKLAPKRAASPARSRASTAFTGRTSTARSSSTA